MNKEQYFYINGQILMETDEEKKMFPHFEGFDEILSQQNLVEKILGKIKSYKSQEEDLKMEGLFRLISMIILDIISIFWGTMILNIGAPWWSCIIVALIGGGVFR